MNDRRPTPPPERLRVVQDRLDELAERVAADPAGVLGEIVPLLNETGDWPRLEAFLWCSHIGAQALRFLDQLGTAVEVAEAGIRVVGERNSRLCAHLHLEAGSSLSQAGESQRAEQHLRDATDLFESIGDDRGLAWALTGRADTLCGLGRTLEAEGLVSRAITLAVQENDQRLELRALKQEAVIHRQIGRTAEGLAVIVEVLDRQPAGHARANALLEYGHLLAQSQDLAAADDAYLSAATEYAVHGDVLGAANTYRALGSTSLLLGRFSNGLEQLDKAADLYESVEDRQGLGYTLRERAVVRLAGGDIEGARSDAERCEELFRVTGDRLGLSSALRAVARVAHACGDHADRDRALGESIDIAIEGGSRLALAGALNMQSEMAVDPRTRLSAAVSAAEAYLEVGVPMGAAYAYANGARAASESSGADGIEELRMARLAVACLHDARVLVSDSGRRTDLDFSSRDVVTVVLEVCRELVGAPGGEAGPTLSEASNVAADLILDDLPLGMRQTLADGCLPESVKAVLDRIERVQSQEPEDTPVGSHGTTSDDMARRARSPHLLRQLSVAVTALDPRSVPSTVSFAAMQRAYPHAAILALGAPTHNWSVPVCFATPGVEPSFALHQLSESDVDDIDALGRVDSAESLVGALADAGVNRWTDSLAEALLPEALQEWAAAGTRSAVPEGAHSPTRELILFLHSGLAHLPIEALDSTGEPLGMRLAIRRLPAPAVRGSDRTAHPMQHLVASFDSDLGWEPEQDAIAAARRTWPTVDLLKSVDLRRALGPNRLIIVGSHGAAGIGLTGGLHASDGTLLLDSVDIMRRSLRGSTVILESCWSGRHLGKRTGEQLSLATACLLAGADAVVAGLFALPADPDCTGRMVSVLINEIVAGQGAAEALRRARDAYLADPPESLRKPGMGREGSRPTTMPGRSPLAWAGLCSFG